MQKFLILILLPFSSIFGQSTDFNHFITLQSSGPIPKDFYELAGEKVANDNTKNDKIPESSDLDFKNGIYYSLGNLLHSGLCVYGDPVSNYVEQVAKRLLKDDPETFSKLRFYTVKSNISNAFSTHQGIIIFTTGIVSQFANEAQLAFVLAHEIVHFQEDHVVQKFEWELENEPEDYDLNQFNSYTKEKEFEADSKAASMCLKAGYSVSEIYNSFDVLMFCHLPFDEIEFPKDYFNTELLFVPEKAFTTSVFPIKMDEDFDDEYSTHPNIKKRKDTIRPVLENDFGKGLSFIGSVDTFNTMRNYARFESVRTNIIETKYSEALYQIFLLELEFPHNYTLTRWKAHCWNGVLNSRLQNYWYQPDMMMYSYEGQSAILYHFIANLNEQAVSTMSLRVITDALKEFPESQELKEVRQSMLKIITSSYDWSWDQYSVETFDEAFRKQKEKIDSIHTSNNVIDTIVELKKEPLNKYDRIRGTTVREVIEEVYYELDSLDYFYYGISDLIKDSLFMQEYDSLSVDYSDSDYDNFKNDYKNSKNGEKIIHDRLLVVEPSAIYMNGYNYDYQKSDESVLKLSDAIHTVARSENVEIYDYDSPSLKNGGTALFNDRNILMSCFLENSMHEKFNLVPIDYELIQELIKSRGTDKVFFPFTRYSRNKRGIAGNIIVGVCFPPILPFMLAKTTSKLKTFSSTFIILNLKDLNYEYSSDNYYNSAGGKLVLQNEIYNVFNAKK